MADDTVPTPEQRDEVLARALEVEPLDELTRRRLVSGALAATPPGTGSADATAGADTPGTRRARVLGVAAAAVAFVVLGVAALTLPGGEGDLATRAPGAPTAASDQAIEAPVRESEPTPLAAGAESRTANDAGTQSSPSLPDLGRLGELGTDGSRERVLTAAAPLVEGVEPQRWSFTFQACEPHTLDVVASGLGTIDGTPVQVLVSRRADGALRVRAIDGTTCRLRSLP